jgi:hypothetical protein
MCNARCPINDGSRIQSSRSHQGANFLRQNSQLDSIANMIRKGKYRTQSTSKKVLRTPGMISVEERKLLTFLAAETWQRDTNVVDGGSFLGASTCALIDGLRRNPDFESDLESIIHSYDLFTADEYMADGSMASCSLWLATPGYRRKTKFEHTRGCRET